jgi:hypothetical protein
MQQLERKDMNEGINVTESGELRAMVGADAMQLMRVRTIKRGLDMYAATGGRMILTRGATPKRLLAIAGEYTGKAYKNTEAGRKACMADLQVWIANMESALPVSVVK